MRCNDAPEVQSEPEGGHAPASVSFHTNGTPQRIPFKSFMRDIARRAFYRTYDWYHRPKVVDVPIMKLLQGGDCGIPGAQYARMVGDLRRTSRQIPEWPHSQFLEAYKQRGESIFNDEVIRGTSYYKNAAQAIELTGNYFRLKGHADIVAQARSFVAHFEGRSSVPLAGSGHSPEGSYIQAVRLLHSDCVMVEDGHHRAAIAYARGLKTIKVAVRGPAQRTAVQNALLDVTWQHGKPELYQPVDVPEVGNWTLVRLCSDRLAKMLTLLRAECPDLLGKGTFLDIGSMYGWFVSKMEEAGYRAFGIERDPFAVELGPLLYGLRPGQIIRTDCVTFLKNCKSTYDVVSCLSVLHHFAQGRGTVSAESLIRLIDGITGRVLFVDTGQSHEHWFRKTGVLGEWTTEYIEQWLRSNTSFSTIVRLGKDADDRPPYSGNYGRMLFACIR